MIIIHLITVLNSKGKTAYKLTVNTADIKEKNKLYICVKDSKTGEYLLVNNKVYTVSKNGNVNVSMSAKKHYVLLNKSEMKQLSNQILKSAALKQNKVTMKPGERIKLEFSESFNMKNAESISYENSDKKVIAISKKGSVRAKKSGKATIKVKVTLKNGEVKILKAKITIQK